MNNYEKHPNAKKWTREVVMEHLCEIEKEANDGKSLFLSKALTKRSLYRHIWTYWKRLFEQDEDIVEMILRIESLFEAKLLDAALNKEVSAWVAIMALKRNYDWAERQVNPYEGPKPLLQRNHRD
jgi:hypothetical protein